MLTLKQINEVSFRKSSFSGYKPEDVDEFIDEVSESFTALLKENQAYKAKASELAAKNAEMREKMVVLAEKVEAYRDDEDGIKDALLSAQKLGSASIKEAKKKAEVIVSDATAKADVILEDAKNKSFVIVSNYENKIAQKQREFDSIKAAVTTFRSSLYEMYRNHITAIESIPDFSKELKKKEARSIDTSESFESQPSLSIPETKPEPQPQPTSAAEVEEYIPDDIEDFADISSDIAADYQEDIAETNTYDSIDLNAYADIPETLKKEKESLYSTLEFGDGIDIKK